MEDDIGLPCEYDVPQACQLLCGRLVGLLGLEIQPAMIVQHALNSGHRHNVCLLGALVVGGTAGNTNAHDKQSLESYAQIAAVPRAGQAATMSVGALALLGAFMQ